MSDGRNVDERRWKSVPPTRRLQTSIKSTTTTSSTLLSFSTMLLSSARSAVSSAGLGRRAASTIALKYSNAVFSAALAKSPQTLNKVQSELNAIASSLKETPELNAFVTNPTLSAKDRTSGLPNLIAKAEGTSRGAAVTDITKKSLRGPV